MIDDLKKNVETEIAMFSEISNYNKAAEKTKGEVQRVYLSAINSLRKRLKIVNNSIPKLVSNISLAKELPERKVKVKKTGLEKVSIKGKKGGVSVATLQKKDREEFLKELSISEGLIKKLKKRRLVEKEEKPVEFKGSRGYLKLSNKFFLDYAIKLIKKGKFKALSLDIKKANFELLTETYVAMIFFTTVISVFAGLFLVLFLLFFKIGWVFPFFSIFEGNYLLRILKIFWVLPALPVLTFLALYFYPSTEKRSLEKRIDQELPFAVIHMSSISGSGIAPAEIFKIIGLSKDYRYLGKEIRKVLNQINIYGYDLGTALTNASKSASSPKLAELFSGLSTTITSGGSLTEFFEKRAESLLVQYRLEREKFSKMAETFMDIYISVVIATPMILMLLLIMISITGIEIGLSPTGVGLIIIVVIALINIFFLFFLNIKQPSY